MIEYTQNLSGITETMLEGFFVGWPSPPSTQSHLKILSNSYSAWLAVDVSQNKVIGFITAISDGVLSAYIPLLEVLPEYQGRGIGKELVSRMLDSLSQFYMIDLLCDENLQNYYQKLGMRKSSGMFIRNYERQSCE